jgi:hypothetical protein
MQVMLLAGFERIQPNKQAIRAEDRALAHFFRIELCKFFWPDDIRMVHN